jgi:uncharacterized membrane protein YeaQ/YmgE (transglycosylase-associated protein family)
MMIMFAAVILDPTSIAAWIVIGFVSGWLAANLLEAPSYGIGGDLMLGSIGGLVGGFLFGIFAGSDPNYWWSLAVALLGACVLIGGARAVAAARNA